MRSAGGEHRGKRQAGGESRSPIDAGIQEQWNQRDAVVHSSPSYPQRDDVQYGWGDRQEVDLVGLSDELVVPGDRMTPGMADEVRRAHQKAVKVTGRRDL